MSKLLSICAAAFVVAVPLYAAAQVIYQGPGTYSTYDNQTSGPSVTRDAYGYPTNTPGPNRSGTTNQNYGNQTNTAGPNRSGTTNQAYGNQTYGPSGTQSTYQTYTYGPGRSGTIIKRTAIKPTGRTAVSLPPVAT